jgi:hypothetical protein
MQVGISFNDGRTQMEKLAVVADKFKNMDDGPKKVALAMQLFGRSARADPDPQPRPRGHRAAQREDGGIWRRQRGGGRQGRRARRERQRDQARLHGHRNVLTDALAPAFTDLVDGVNDLIKAFIESYNSGGIVKVIFDVISGAIQIVVAVVEGAGRDLQRGLERHQRGRRTDIGKDFADVFGASVPENISVTKLAQRYSRTR